MGSGGLGVVYKAEHIYMKRRVALKMLAAEIEGNAAVRRLLMQADPTQFDPALRVAFCECESAFEQVFAGAPD